MRNARLCGADLRDARQAFDEDCHGARYLVGRGIPAVVVLAALVAADACARAGYDAVVALGVGLWRLRSWARYAAALIG